MTPVDECIVTPRRDGKDGGSAELPHMDAKLVTRTASGLGPIGKVDSSNDLQPTGSLRCMAVRRMHLCVVGAECIVCSRPASRFALLLLHVHLLLHLR